MADLNFPLLPWQQEVFADKTRFKVIAAGRRCGKSRLAATTLIIEALKCPAGSAVLYVSPTMGQSRQIIWDLLLEIGREVISGSHVNNLDITMINGAKIYVRGADRPDTLRGVSLTYAVLDEVADIKPEAWEQVIRASLSDKKGRAIFDIIFRSVKNQLPNCRQFVASVDYIYIETYWIGFVLDRKIS